MDGYADFLRGKALRLPERQPYLAPWVRESLLFTQERADMHSGRHGPWVVIC